MARHPYAIGPPIDDGNYDLELPGQISETDLPKIEDRMREIVAADQPFVREELRARRRSNGSDQPYKREIIESLEEGEVPAGETVTVYRNDGWADLCLGPHVPSTGRLGGAFKLMKLAGAYWRGELADAAGSTARRGRRRTSSTITIGWRRPKRDHRRPGASSTCSPSPRSSDPVSPSGTHAVVCSEAARGLRQGPARGGATTSSPRRTSPGVSCGTPRATRPSTRTDVPRDAARGRPRVLRKPMNCPFHVLVYKSQIRSYRDLPMRLSELGGVYRYERLGVVHGLLRTRGFTQDDSHIVCREDQLVDEILGVFDLTLEIHRTFGFTDPVVTLSTLPGEIVTPEMAERATGALRAALERSGLAFEVAEGEGSFYGPKVDFHFRDAIGRLWQLTTVQCDFGLPERFEMEYVGEDNGRHRPVMIHRAILGIDRALQRRADRALRRSRCGSRPSRCAWSRWPTVTSSTRASSRRCSDALGLRPRWTGAARQWARRSGPRSSRRA